MKRTPGLRCTIGNHPARPQIDLAIATGLSKRAVAERFGVSRDVVWRHGQAHLTAEMRAALKPVKGIGHCRDHFRRKWKAGEFPKPIAVSDRIAFREDEIDDWLASRPRRNATAGTR